MGDGTTKTETEIAKEVVNNAIEDSKKDDSVIIAVKTETVENATKTEIKQDDVPIVEPVEETTSTITTDVVIENCTDIVSDNFEDLNWD